MRLSRAKRSSSAAMSGGEGSVLSSVGPTSPRERAAGKGAYVEAERSGADIAGGVGDRALLSGVFEKSCWKIALLRAKAAVTCKPITSSDQPNRVRAAW